MLRVKVADGGTNAGHRIVKTLPDWRCRCFWVPLEPRWHPGTAYSCGDCGLRRP